MNGYIGYCMESAGVERELFLMLKRRNLSHDEEGRKLTGERDPAGHGTGNEKVRETKDAMDLQHEKWTEMSFDKLLRERRSRGRWHRLVHEATNHWNEDG